MKTLAFTIVPNAAPTVADLAVSTDEDTAKAITLSGQDVDGDALTFQVLSRPAHGTLSGTAPNLTFTPEANYHGADSFTFKANDGSEDSGTAAVQITVSPVNDVPVAKGDAYEVDEDGALEVNGVLANDTDVEGQILTAVKVSEPAHGTLVLNANGSFSYHPEANYHGADTFTYQANDGTVGSAAATVTLTVKAVNDAPEAAAQNVETDEDTAANVVLSGSDLETAATDLAFQVTVQPQHGKLSGTAPNVTYAPDANFYGEDSFQFTVTDGPDGSSAALTSSKATVTLVVKPVNDAPAVAADQASVTVAEGAVATNSGTWSDIESDAVKVTASIGSVSSNGGSWSWSLTTSDGPVETQDVQITATDAQGGSTSVKFGLVVTNVAPQVTISGPAAATVVAVNTPVALTGSFTDAGTGDTHTAEWTASNGATAAGAVTRSASGGAVSGSLSFPAAGIYSLSLEVKDDESAAGTANTVGGDRAFVVVYDPNGGFGTGGGSINSPGGAYAADPTAAGKATFGLNCKYKKGATVPEGQTEFQFSAGSLNFKSTAYEWLVVSGAKAQFRGTGTINGAGSYDFLLTVVDGQVNGGGGQDRFRIKIRDRAHGNELVYDNQVGTGDDAALGDTTVLRGGSIVIHQP